MKIYGYDNHFELLEYSAAKFVRTNLHISLCLCLFPLCALQLQTPYLMNIQDEGGLGQFHWSTGTCSVISLVKCDETMGQFNKNLKMVSRNL